MTNPFIRPWRVVNKKRHIEVQWDDGQWSLLIIFPLEDNRLATYIVELHNAKLENPNG